ncbi:hypothetical protein Q7C36_017623 [Tachysurus vachellii]|uniref:Uncharacterized protein n=1 Tax=Tachysurus vachellii TaxID=175792 RepID=A0AA88M3X6_TACVA|nr:hypothetical protein Q7C36_017623 [Tachysurus vachellii]
MDVKHDPRDDVPNVPQIRRDFRNSGTHQVGVCESSKGKIAAVGLGQIPTVDFKTAAEGAEGRRVYTSVS